MIFVMSILLGKEESRMRFNGGEIVFDLSDIDETHVKCQFVLIGMNHHGNACILYQFDTLDRVVTYGIDEAFECVDKEFEDEDYKLSFLDSLQIWDTKERVCIKSEMDECITRIKTSEFPPKDARIRYLYYYWPSISHHTVSNLIWYAEMENNADLINMIIEVIRADTRADFDNLSLSNDKIREYYRSRYYDKLAGCKLTDKRILDELEQLLRE